MNSPTCSHRSFADFHYFPLLPKELRDVIWEYAALPSVPGIHFFKLETVLGRRQGEDRTEAICQLGMSPTSGFMDGLGFGRNASSYFNNLAVWDACCESRHMLETLRSRGRFGHGDGPLTVVQDVFPEEILPYRPLRGWGGTDGEDCQCSYKSHAPGPSVSGHRDLLVNLEKDVICLTLDLHHLTFRRGGDEILEIPQLRALKESFPVRKLALQYHPEWAGGLSGITPGQEEVLQEVLDMFSSYVHLPLLECVYFIDYRITPKPGAYTDATLRPGSAVFHGRGKTFYDVTRDDDRWTFLDEQPFMLCEELDESRSTSRAWCCADSAEGEDPDKEDKEEVMQFIEQRAKKWGLNMDQKCQFRVLASVPST